MRFAGATRARYSLDIIKGNGVQEKSGLLSSSIPTISSTSGKGELDGCSGAI